jgi:hypothetical protein
MTGAERVRRHRYLRGWVEMQLNRMLKKHRRAPQQHNWNRVAPADVLGNELAWACFDMESHLPNLDRWNEIDRCTRESLARLEHEFASFRYKPFT